VGWLWGRCLSPRGETEALVAHESWRIGQQVGFWVAKVTALPFCLMSGHSKHAVYVRMMNKVRLLRPFILPQGWPGQVQGSRQPRAARGRSLPECPYREHHHCCGSDTSSGSSRQPCQERRNLSPGKHSERPWLQQTDLEECVSWQSTSEAGPVWRVIPRYSSDRHTLQIQHALDNRADHCGFAKDNKLEPIRRDESDVFARNQR